MYQAPKARPRELWNTHYVSVLYIKRRTITRGEHNIHDPRSTRDRPETDPRPTRDRPEIDPRSTRDRHERSTQHSIPQRRDSPRLTDIDPTVLLGTRPRGIFCPTGFYPPRAEIDPRSTRDRHERSTQHSMPQSPLSGGPLPPHPERPCPSRVANGVWGGGCEKRTGEAGEGEVHSEDCRPRRGFLPQGFTLRVRIGAARG